MAFSFAWLQFFMCFIHLKSFIVTNLDCGEMKSFSNPIQQAPNDSSKVAKEPKKPHQNVQLTYSNGSITNISVNISEELGKTSIWRTLTESNKGDLMSQP